MHLFHILSQRCSKATTEQYSTSFSKAIKLLRSDMRIAVYNIYGFVRLADEIVDTFHDYDKATLLAEFKNETSTAIKRGVSLNPILHSFQRTVNEYDLPHDLIESFFASMEMDLSKTTYNYGEYKQYIYGSAEVVGLMCLHIFCDGNKEMFIKLQAYAQSLGAAFQKVNFLRDLKSDYQKLGRIYFPSVDFANFTVAKKNQVENEITADFANAYEGILKLPVSARFAVYVAFKYYNSLFKKIKRSNASSIFTKRIRIHNYSKIFILAKAGVRSQFNIL
jgi:phytoene synthase